MHGMPERRHSVSNAYEAVIVVEELGVVGSGSPKPPALAAQQVMKVEQAAHRAGISGFRQMKGL
jgi:hypothetical protein